MLGRRKFIQSAAAVVTVSALPISASKGRKLESVKVEGLDYDGFLKIWCGDHVGAFAPIRLSFIEGEGWTSATRIVEFKNEDIEGDEVTAITVTAPPSLDSPWLTVDMVPKDVPIPLHPEALPLDVKAPGNTTAIHFSADNLLLRF